MMLDALVLGLDARTRFASLSHTTITVDELLQVLVRGLGIDSKASSKLDVLRDIQSFLDEWTAAGRNAVFVIDEAQNLTLPVLEEIRLLSNLRSQGHCSLQIVLSGQPELRAKLDHPDLLQLRQRIGIRYHLTPLSASETGEYIRHRLRVAGADDPRIFDKAAIETIYRYSKGVPRVVNIVCERALVAGYGSNRKRLGRGLILEVVEEVEGRIPDELTKPPRSTGPASSHDASAPERTARAADTASPVGPEAEPEGVRKDGRAERPETAHSGSTPRARQADSAGPSRSDGRAGARRNASGRGALPRASHVGPRGSSRAREGEEALEAESVTAWTRSPRRRAPNKRSWLAPVALAIIAVVVVAYVAHRLDWGRSTLVAGDETAREAPSAPLEDRASVPAVVDEAAQGSRAPDAVPTAEPRSPTAVAGGGESAGAGAGPKEAASVEAASPAGESGPAHGPGGEFRAIALSSRDREAAGREAARLTGRGFDAEILLADLGERGLWYRVAVVGGYPSLEDASTVVEELKDLGYTGAWVNRG